MTKKSGARGRSPKNVSRRLDLDHSKSSIYHTYSAYARGLDALWGMWQWLDRAPKGRNETGHWWRRHDEYDNFCSS